MLYKYLIKKLATKIGYEIKGYHPLNSSLARIMMGMQNFQVDVVLDVGANKGQYAKELRQGGYKGRIISFEPLESAHGALKKNSQNDSQWEIYPQCAIGAENGWLDINIANNSVSSSVLPMLKQHEVSAPDSKYIGVQRTEVKSLDFLAPELFNNSDSVFLKIDTQGFEGKVLDGAKETLRSSIYGIQIELSVIALYQDQPLWIELIERLYEMGFELWSLEPAFIDPISGRVLQYDGIFFRA